MSTNTNCSKCLFADHSDSNTPCVMGIIDRIKPSKNITVSDTNFNIIHQYRCPFAFSMEVYKNNLSELGSIEDLKNQLISKATIAYYLVLFLDPNHINDVCNTLRAMIIKPKYISFIVVNNNNTEDLIETIKTNIPAAIGWKLHNFLEQYDLQDSLDTVLETNTAKNNITYFWVDHSKNHAQWSDNILRINDILAVEQPMIHALFRKDTDGLFLTFANYKIIIDQYQTDIITAIQTIPNRLLQYYG